MSKVLLLALKAYHWLKRLAGSPTCRFYPSCSHYTGEAIQIYGPLKGSLMGLWRILRCSPLSKGGYDPVR